MNTTRPNAPCPCNSSKKYEQCCQPNEAQAASPPTDIIPVHNAIRTAMTHHQAGQLAQAEAIYRQILQQQPDHPDALYLLGVIADQTGNTSIAIALYREALNIKPDYAEAHQRLGLALKNQGKLDEAIVCYREALALEPGYADAYHNLGLALAIQGKLDEAAESYRNALIFKPDSIETLSNLGIVLRDQGKLDEAIESYQQALTIKPDYADAHNNLGHALHGQGKLDEASASFYQALKLKPDLAAAYSNLLFCLSHDPTISAETLFTEHCRFGVQFETPLLVDHPQHAHSQDPERALRIGFISGDFFNHPIAYFIEQVMAHLSRSPRLSLHAYYNNTIEDTFTQRIRTHFTQWQNINILCDSALAEKIHSESIDILIDLSGHTAKNRLLTFARKPAPVQASWMGYAGTTGLMAMDYYLTDQFCLPPKQFDHQFTEKIVRLATHATFLPAAGAPPVNALPALCNGYMTFGSFNRLSKLSPSVITLWSQLLRALPDSKILLGGMPEEGKYNELIDWFEQEGIMRDRLRFHTRCGMDAYLELHQQVDICLDTSPYNGGTTTFHALWMGIPTLTLAGSTPAGRSGVSILCQAGLEAFIALDTADFVQKGLSWANNLATLSDIRTGLRDHIAMSAMGQPEVIAAGVERALRIMWQRWCAGLPAESFEVPLKDINSFAMENNK
jgi:protein O-GlcNAc transferase